MDNLQERLDNLAMRINMEPHMIDPVEFGEIKGAVASLQHQVTDIKTQLSGINTKQDVVINQLSEAKGGWKIMMMLGGGAGAMGAAIASFFGKGAT